MSEGLEGSLARIDARCRSNTQRIEELESSQRAVTELALSVRAMATEQCNMKADLGEVKKDVKSLTLRAGARFEALMDKALWLILGGALGLLLKGLGIE